MAGLIPAICALPLAHLPACTCRHVLARYCRRIANLEAVAAAAGVNVRKPGGSHVVFEHPDLAEALSVPARRPIKPIYVQRFVRFIDAVRGAHERD